MACPPAPSEGRSRPGGRAPSARRSASRTQSITPQRHCGRRPPPVHTPTWTRTRTWTFGGSRAIPYTIGIHQAEWTGRGIEPRSPGCRPGIFPLDEQPIHQRSVRESNPAFRLTKAVCSRSTYRPSLPLIGSDPGWNRTITFLDVGQVSSPLDHGIRLSVTEVGVEPTKSRGSRPRRFASLRTRPIE